MKQSILTFTVKQLRHIIKEAIEEDKIEGLNPTEVANILKFLWNERMTATSVEYEAYMDTLKEYFDVKLPNEIGLLDEFDELAGHVFSELAGSPARAEKLKNSNMRKKAMMLANIIDPSGIKKHVSNVVDTSKEPEDLALKRGKSGSSVSPYTVAFDPQQYFKQKPIW